MTFDFSALRPRATPVLTRLGIDPKRFWLLMDLFQQISERGEMLDQLGRNGVALRTASLFYFGFAGLLSLVFAFTGMSAIVYFGIFMALTVFLLLSVLVTEAGNSLINPGEAMVLAHQPINGATYTAAKLSHLLRIVLYLVPGINAVPALVGWGLTGATWYYPFLHLGAAFALGLLTALFCCALFGWMLRFIPVRRLKASGQFVGTLPFLGMMFGRRTVDLGQRMHFAALLPHDPAIRWALAITAVFASIFAVVFGMRSLTADYLIRVAAITRGGAHAGSRARRSLLGGMVRRLFGGQTAVAGFAFTSRMMLRDWQFRRQILPLLIFPLASLGSAFSSGWPGDPFLRHFSGIHLLPHALGFFLLFICMQLRYGNDYKGVWIFLSVPSGGINGFARGVHALLWLVVILIPNLIALPVLSWRWGIGHAALFIAYSIAATSIYLGLELLLIEYLPFSKQLDTSAQAMSLPLMMGCALVASIAVALQYFLIFLSPLIAAGVTAVLVVAAYFATKASLNTFAVAMRYHLGLVSAETGPLYKEIAV